MKDQMSVWNQGWGLRKDNAHVAKIPAEITLYGKNRAVADSQGYPVDIGPRLGLETGMEILRHAMGMSDPGRVTTEEPELDLTSIQAWKAGTGPDPKC